MLRAVLVILLLANLLFWGWREGVFASLGMAPTPIREPQRLQQQVAPERVRLLPLTPAGPAASSAAGTAVAPATAASAVPAPR
jgi:hypothetical protein